MSIASMSNFFIFIIIPWLYDTMPVLVRHTPKYLVAKKYNVFNVSLKVKENQYAPTIYVHAFMLLTKEND